MGSVAAVNIASSGQGLQLNRNSPDHVLATVRSEGLEATCSVCRHYAYGFGDLARFFEQLARDWAGWPEVRVWESLEHDLRIAARHEFGHVQLRVTLRKAGPGWGNEGWTVTVDLTLDPGEQLAQIASNVADLAGEPP